MATELNQRKRSRGNAAIAAASGASWMALVAATTFGLGSFERVRAEVKVEATPGLAGSVLPYRLIVQCYAPDSVRAGRVREHARPLGSAQRSVTTEELQRGVAVDVLRVGEDSSDEEPPVVVAWVEPGDADLDFDALRARPSDSAVFGVSEAHDASAHLVLKHAA